MAFVKNKDGKRLRVSPGTKGAIGEHAATAWLLSQGYDVFRNVSPNGRADLLAVDWDSDETIRVDVKSHGFLRTADARAAADREKVELNQGFDIKYLVVNDDLSCGWYEDGGPTADNDNEKPTPTWWRDKKTAQRFLTPGREMSNKQWSYFCHWLLRAYPDYIIPFSEQFVRSVSSRGIGCDRPQINEKEIRVLKKLHRHVFDKLVDIGSVEFIEEIAA